MRGSGCGGGEATDELPPRERPLPVVRREPLGFPAESDRRLPPTLVLRASRCTLRRVEANGLDAIVARSPDVMSGALVFRGTRVLVKTLLDHLAAGESLDEFLDQFPTVKREQATALLSAAEALIQARLDEDPAR